MPATETRASLQLHQHELMVAQRRVDALDEQAGGLLTIGGGIGSGKTTFARAVSAYASRRGVMVAWATATRSTPRVDFPPTLWSEVLLPLLPSGEGSGARPFGGDRVPLANLTPTLEPTPHPSDVGSATGDFNSTVRRVVVAAAQRRPLMLVFDNLQWLDDASLHVLESLISICVDVPLLLTVLFRSPPLCDTKIQAFLAHAHDSLVRTHIVLKPLTAVELGTYAREVLGAGLDEPNATRLYRFTGGSVLLARELLAQMIVEGRRALNLENQTEVLESSPIVRALIQEQLAAASLECLAMLRYAALSERESCSEALGLAIAAELHTVPQLVQPLLEEACALGILQETPSGRYCFTQELTRAALLGDQPLTSQAKRHASMARAEESLSKPRGDHRHAEAIAEHFSAASALSPRFVRDAIRANYAAGTQLESENNWAVAARYYERTLHLLNQAESAPDQDPGATLVGLGRCLRNGGHPERAWEYLARAISLYAGRSDWLGQARTALEIVTVPASDEEHLAVIRRVLAEPGEREAGVEGELLAWAARFSSTRDGSRRRPPDVAVEAPAATKAARAQMTFLQAVAASRRYEFAEASELFVIAAHQFDENGHINEASDAWFRAASVQLFAGRLGRALRLCVEQQAYAHARGLAAYENLALTMRGLIATSQGDVETAHRLLQQVSGQPPIFAYGIRIITAAFKPPDARPHLSDLLPPIVLSGVTSSLVNAHGLRAQAFHLYGEDEAARLELAAWQQAMADVATTPAGPNAAHATIGDALVDLGSDGQVEETLTAIAGNGIRFCAGHSMDRIRGDLALRLGRNAKAEEYYQAGLAECRREGAHPEAARCYLGLASIAIREHELRLARAHLREGRWLAEVCGHWGLQEQAGRLERELVVEDGFVAIRRLTKREVALLQLVASGRTNAAIAVELSISARTVANHVHSILEKMNAGNRTEAVDRARRLRLLE